MHPAIRTQSDGLGDIVSLETGIDFAGAVDKTRQEDKETADINIMMAKFGLFAPQKQLYFGDVDYGIDLQQALGAIADAKRAWQVMPPELKKEFPSWRELLNGLESGQIKLNEGEAPIVTEPLQTGATVGAQST